MAHVPSKKIGNSDINVKCIEVIETVLKLIAGLIVVIIWMSMMLFGTWLYTKILPLTRQIVSALLFVCVSISPSIMLFLSLKFIERRKKLINMLVRYVVIGLVARVSFYFNKCSKFLLAFVPKTSFSELKTINKRCRRWSNFEPRKNRIPHRVSLFEDKVFMKDTPEDTSL